MRFCFWFKSIRRYNGSASNRKLGFLFSFKATRIYYSVREERKLLLLIRVRNRKRNKNVVEGESNLLKNGRAISPRPCTVIIAQPHPTPNNSNLMRYIYPFQ